MAEDAKSFVDLSPAVQPLANDDARLTLGPVPADTVAARAILRVREEMARKHLSQRDIAGILKWTQSRVSKNLNGHIELGVNDLADLCFAVGIPVTEAVRDHGLEFCAELAPYELRLLARIREVTPAVRDAIFTLLQLKMKPAEPERYAKKPKKRGLG